MGDLEELVCYGDNHPRSKDLPSILSHLRNESSHLLALSDLGRGTLFDSSPEALLYYWPKWIFAQIFLFLLPLAVSCGLAGFFFGSSLGLFGQQSPPELAYVLAFLCMSAGLMTVFLVVMKNTMVHHIFEILADLGLVSANGQDQFYFTHNGRKIAWIDTMESLGIGPVSHLFLKLIVPGGARGEKRSPSSSPSPPAKKKSKSYSAMTQSKTVYTDEDDAEDEDNEGPPHKQKLKAVCFFFFLLSLGLVPKPSIVARSIHRAKSDGESDEASDSERPSKQRKRKARPLNKIAHNKEKGWKRHNDYGPHGYETAEELVEVKHFGHPVDRPMDIRAQPFILRWITPDCEAPEALSNNPRPVYRAYFKCLGNCSDLPPLDDDQSEDSDTPPLPDKSKPEKSKKKPVQSDSDSDDSDGKKGTRRTCPQKVILHIEVYSNNLSKAIIYRQKTHWETAEEHLTMSQHIRQCIMEYASLANMTAGRIKQCELAFITSTFQLTAFLLGLLVVYKEKKTPLFRHPSAMQVDNIVTNIRRNERLNMDPLNFRPVDMSTNPLSKFATGIKSIHALQSLLLWAFVNGIGLDSCWRHKNENCAPVTFITTVDQNKRMLPGPVYISANITAETLQVFLQEVKGLIEQMARDLLNEDVEVHPSHAQFAPELMQAAKHVRDNKWNWVPLIECYFNGLCYMHANRPFGSVGNDASSWARYVTVWPGVTAIIRWDQDTNTACPKLSRPSKDKLLHAVHKLQRCRSADDWATEVENFKTGIASFADASTTSIIMQYFKRNWFIASWRGV
ncbi:hypothetical protein FB451DRAFT_1184708 [Mycena latifolia]|nr:hypothetical protein FB451DRAFT_1184708 [Mycena latifolia]